MAEKVDKTSWVYVLVQDPGKEERIVGQFDPDSDISFIPAFRDKESALQGDMHLTREPRHKYEFQAIIMEDLQQIASNGRFNIFILDGDGNILDRVKPDPPNG